MRRFAALALSALLGACSHHETRYQDADELYYADRPEQLIERYSAALEDDGPDALLGKMKILSSRLLLHDWEAAEALALEVSTAVNVYLAGLEGERDALSLAGRERDKPFKGEPHEQVMADFYLGLLRYRRDEFEGALSCFRSALQKDRGVYLLPVRKESARRGEDNVATYLYDSDYAACELFAAKCWFRLGEEKEALAALDRARGLRPDLAELFERAMDGANNVIILIEAGRAPFKRAGGSGGAVLQYRRGPQVRVHEVRLDGVPLAFGVMDDLHRQATTLGGRGVDALNQEKARRQEALETIGFSTAIAGTLLAFSGDETLSRIGLIGIVLGLTTAAAAGAAIDPRADTRAWSTLPGTLILAVGAAEPGTDHDLVVRSTAAPGPLTQEWSEIELAAEENFLWIRLLGGARAFYVDPPAFEFGADPDGAEVPPPDAARQPERIYW